MRFFILLSLSLLCITACAAVEPAQPEAPSSAPPLDDSALAADYCREKGGRVELRIQDDDSLASFCLFDDDSECDLLAFFHDQCRPGGAPGLGHDPAKEKCVELGGTIEARSRFRDGRDHGEYQACVLSDGRQCELQALYDGFCPETGLSIQGLTTPAAVYCVLLGGKYVATRSYPEVAFEREEGSCVFGNGAECPVWALYSGECGQYFNETVDRWRYLKLVGPWLLVGYPEAEVSLAGLAPEGRDLVLSLSVEPMGEIAESAPWGYDRQSSEKERVDLENGLFGLEVDFPVAGSKRVVRFPSGAVGKVFTVLAREDPCRAVAEQRLILYRNGFRVILSLEADVKLLSEQYPEYFAPADKKCGPDDPGPVWDMENAGEIKFYRALEEGRLVGPAALWRDVFERIVEALVFLPD